MRAARDHIYILQVEDNLDDVELTQIAFKQSGFPYEVVVMTDGAKALDFLLAQGEFAGRDKHDTPALILLDLNLPKLHGLEVLKILKADPLLKYVLVVVLTSSNEEKDRERAAMLGTNLYIQKPVKFDDFGGVVRQIEEALKALKPENPMKDASTRSHRAHRKGR